jgi:cardiolipin synthase
MLRYVPNILTLSRFPLSLVIAVAHNASHFKTALGFAVAACITDFLDGKLARWLKCESVFGAMIDPYADKILCWTLTAIVAHVVYENIDFTLLMLPVLVVIALYDVALGIIRYVWKNVQIPTNSYAKTKTTWLMIALLLFYLNMITMSTSGPLPSWIAIGCGWLASYFALRSAFVYLRAYLRPAPAGR